MKMKLLWATLALLATSNALFATSQINDTVVVEKNTKFETPRFSNIKVRAIMRTEFRAEADQGEALQTNFRLKPAMIDFSGDLGDRVSFHIRPRFDWSPELQKDGVAPSLSIAWVKLKANDKLSFVLGKQLMAMGGQEFRYNPVEVFHYSLFTNTLQLFQTGASAYYHIGQHTLAAQMTIVTNSEFKLSNFNNAWNSNIYWSGNFWDGFYRHNVSYMFTNAGAGNNLHSVVLGNQFNFSRIKIDLDLSRQNGMRFYTDAEKGRYQAKTTERSAVGFAEYTFPGNRLLFGLKGALEKRFISETEENVTRQLTTSAQLRYRLLPRYGITLHAVYAHRFESANERFGADWPGRDQDSFSTGLVWDFTHKR